MNEPEDITKKAPVPGRARARPLIGMLVLVVLLTAGAVVYFSGAVKESTQIDEDAGAPGSAEQFAFSSAEPGDRADEVGALGVPVQGNEDAPVVMVEFADFQCPFCGQFAREIKPGLVEEYVENGTLRMEWRDFPYLGQESVNAALAARAAQEQGKFWEYHDLLYQNQGARNSKAFTDEKLISLAQELGLDVERFQESFTSGKYEEIVGKDFEEGTREGISGTPTFFINGEPLVGTQPVETFEEAIEEAAREAEDG